jgi:hypothetical protein
MGPLGSKKTYNLEVQIQKALYALKKNKDFPATRAAAQFFKLDHRTLQRRRDGGKTQSQSHEMVQILTNAEEDILLRCIKQYTITGSIFPTRHC